ncbi:hypothetical protein AAG570_011576 [Ranatra chinensis]|uniref:DH domain-containing protein n=1 Tax=Ranatra chinensis TaxID=642074 RepID=A0ABD0YL97_9HEMI
MFLLSVLDNMTMYERALQETKFEIITTELRHLNSLNMFITVFYQCKQLAATCSAEDWDNLFGNIRIVKDASEFLLNDLLVHWQNDIMLNGIYAILRNHATSILRVYVNYCSNQPLANYTLCRLRQNNQKFRELLIQLEANQNDTLQTFLTLPIQRVTRLPLLLEAVIPRLDQSTAEYTACRLAIVTFKKVGGYIFLLIYKFIFGRDSSK